MRREEIVKGEVVAIYAICKDKKEMSVFEEFLNEINEKDRKMIMSKLKSASDHTGLIRDRDIFKHLDYQLYEFKFKRYRLFIFNESNNVNRGQNKELVILFSFKKKSQKTPKRYINRANKIIDRIKTEGYDE